MNPRCAVCSRSGPDVREWATIGGTRYGMACRGECHGLLWESYFIKATGESDDDYAAILWQWQRRRAQVEGRAFTTPFPKTAGDIEHELWLATEAA